MSAYKDLEALLGGTPLARQAIDAALREHAHELAEKVREHPWSDGCAAGCCDDDRGAQKAADLIDPEVSK